MYNYFDTVWQLKKLHSIKELPAQYLFSLFAVLMLHVAILCAGVDKTATTLVPLISHLPLPIPDPARPWGSANCNECKGTCARHFLPPQVRILVVTHITNEKASISCNQREV